MLSELCTFLMLILDSLHQLLLIRYFLPDLIVLCGRLLLVLLLLVRLRCVCEVVVLLVLHLDYLLHSYVKVILFSYVQSFIFF